MKMSIKNTKFLSKQEIEKAIKENITIGAAASSLNVDWRTFKKEAKKYNLYNPVKQGVKKFNLEDIIFKGLHSQYPTSKLSKRLVREGYKEYKCEKCGISDYNDEPISLELNHINGVRNDHNLNNLELLCPNCHSQTPTYRSKKLKFNKS